MKPQGSVSSENNADYAAGSALKQGYLYIPFSANDLIDQGLGLNLLRHLKGKSLYPLMAPNQKIKIEMEKLRAEEIIKLTNQINTISDKLRQVDIGLKNGPDWSAETLRNVISEDIFDPFVNSIAKFSQQLSVLKRMVFTNKPMCNLSAKNDKLYILGHGGAGMNVLAADVAMTQGYITAEMLAEQLKNGRLPKTFRDIRITACYSADSIKPLSFAPNELAETAGTFSQKRGVISRLFQAPKDTTSFAQAISTALSRHGYHNLQITGYHGAGVTFNQTEYRARRIEGVPDIRRSLVKRFF